MGDLATLIKLKIRLAVSTVNQFHRESKLRMAVITSAGIIFWFLMFLMFYRVFVFLGQFEGIKDILIDYLLAFFFLALLVMMTISNAIICYTSFYRSEESSFLMHLPVRLQHIFSYKGIESVLFSAWGMITLVVPMILAFGISEHAPLQYYFFSIVLAFLFMILPMILGAVLALIVPVIVPRKRKVVLALAILFGLILGGFWVGAMVAQRPTRLVSEAGIKHVVDRIAFCQHWLLPSFWVSEGILAASRGMSGRAGFLTLLLLSNVFFPGIVAVRLSKSLFRPAWNLIHAGSEGRRKIKADGWLDRFIRGLLFFLPLRLRELVLRDIRTFRRDPTQWSQILLFFGLMALYIANLPRFGFTGLSDYWHTLISLLNLGAASLTLSTLTSRFVFPQLSLEGRRIWIVGLIPMERRIVLWGKFLFATVGSLLLSGGLILLSDLMLGLEGWIVTVHLFVLVCACCGLNGLAVGLGAVYPNLRSDNPSEIVSSFGGTLNLICSIVFVLGVLLTVAIPLYLEVIGVIKGQTFRVVLWIALGLIVVMTTIACLIPMKFGIRRFEQMDF